MLMKNFFAFHFVMLYCIAIFTCIKIITTLTQEPNFFLLLWNVVWWLHKIFIDLRECGPEYLSEASFTPTLHWERTLPGCLKQMSLSFSLLGKNSLWMESPGCWLSWLYLNVLQLFKTFSFPTSIPALPHTHHYDQA